MISQRVKLITPASQAPWAAKALGTGVFEFGNTALEALGALVCKHPEMFGVEFHDPGTQEMLTRSAMPNEG